jgi:hypothetical protein
MALISSLCYLCVLCVSVVHICKPTYREHRGNTEDRLNAGLSSLLCRLIQSANQILAKKAEESLGQSLYVDDLTFQVCFMA